MTLNQTPIRSEMTPSCGLGFIVCRNIFPLDNGFRVSYYANGIWNERSKMYCRFEANHEKAKIASKYDWTIVSGTMYDKDNKSFYFDFQLSEIPEGVFEKLPWT